jgi:glycosyltransferase involved in cell wall biosynthesis
VTLRVFMYSAVEPADRGGVQAVYRRLAASLRSQGHQVVQAWSRPDPHDASSSHHALPPPGLGPLLRRPRKLAGACRAVLRLAATLLRFRPDVVNCHFVTAEAWYFAWLKPVFRYRLVVSAHGSDVVRPRPWNAPWIPQVLARADAVTAVSELTGARLEERYGVPRSRLFVIRNGIDTVFWGAVTAVPVGERPPVVLAVGRLHPVKGHDVLLEAFALVASRVADARLVIVGEGGFGTDLERCAESLGIASRVTLTGAEPAPAVRDRLARARCFVLPSRSEGLPLALLEAMAAGTPIVASRVGGIPEVVGEDSAAMVPPEDPAALAAALLAVLSDEKSASARVDHARREVRRFTSAAADAAYGEVLRGSTSGYNPLNEHEISSGAVS